MFGPAGAMVQRHIGLASSAEGLQVHGSLIMQASMQVQKGGLSLLAGLEALS